MTLKYVYSKRIYIMCYNFLKLFSEMLCCIFVELSNHNRFHDYSQRVPGVKLLIRVNSFDLLFITVRCCVNYHSDHILFLWSSKFEINLNSINVNIFFFSFFVHMSTAQNEQRSNILRLRRRFLKDQEKVSLNYAQKEIQQQRQKKVSNMQELAMLILIYPWIAAHKCFTRH